MGRSECDAAISLLPLLMSTSQVFIMGYYVGESVDISAHEATVPQDGTTTSLHIDQRQPKLRTNSKMETYDREAGLGPKVTETSTVGVRYEIKTSGGVVVDNNRKSNRGNKELVSISSEHMRHFSNSPERCI
jgi:hypothetical protein